MAGNLSIQDRATIRSRMDDLKVSGGSTAIWIGYGYHFTELSNVPSILQDNVLYSRQDATLNGLIASEVGDPGILNRTTDSVREYVRFYWRPRTPMLYGIEGIRAQNRYPYDGRCAIPIYFCVPLDDLFSKPAVRFSDRNAASPYANFGETADFVLGIPFDKVFHDGAFVPSERDEIVARRQAEIQVHHSVSLTPNTVILVRSPAELSMLRDILPVAIRSVWDHRIRVATRSPVFFKRWLFVDHVERQKDTVHLFWNPQARLSEVGPVAFTVTFENLNTGYRVDVPQEPITWDGTFMHRYDGLKSYPWRMTIRIDNTVAYVGTLYA
ncbi:MAG: DUF4433 domain-containing protein [Firmicutes bacterium]|nr:DUF4433 domain-containing protein [Bacillota bacterium]